MVEKTFEQMSFADFVAVARKHLDDAERTYAQLVAGADARDDLVNAMADAAYATAMGSSKGLSDALTLSRAERGEFDPADLGDGDLLATADLEDKHGVWWDGPRVDLPGRDGYRADHPFPVDTDTDEEGQW